jgi:hypothetical protein
MGLRFGTQLDLMIKWLVSSFFAEQIVLVLYLIKARHLAQTQAWRCSAFNMHPATNLPPEHSAIAAADKAF